MRLQKGHILMSFSVRIFGLESVTVHTYQTPFTGQQELVQQRTNHQFGSMNTVWYLGPGAY